MSTTSWATLHAVPVIPFLSTMTSSIYRISLRGSLPFGGRALLQLSHVPPAPGWRVLVLPFRSSQPGRVLQGTDGPINVRMGRWLGSMRSRSLAIHVIGTTTTTPLRNDDGSTSGLQSDRLNSVLSLACFVWVFFGGPLCLGACGPCGVRGRLPFPLGLVLILGFSQF
jgi:hypothetical protein